MSDPIAKRFASERGIALVVTLITIVVVVVLGLAVLQNSVSGLRTSGNDRQLKSAVALSEAGVEYAREAIRTQLKGGQTFSTLLSTAANGGTLVDSTTLAGFGGTTATSNATGNTPIVPARAFGSGNFQVFLTNDPLQGGSPSASVQNVTDANGRIMVTSFAGPAGSLAVAQAQFVLYQKLMPGVNLPGFITMPGPDVNFNPGPSHPHFVKGYPTDGEVDKPPSQRRCFPTIAVSTNDTKAKVDTIMCSPGSGNTGNYLSCQATDTQGNITVDFENPKHNCDTKANGNGKGNGGNGGSTDVFFDPSTENFFDTTASLTNPYSSYYPNSDQSNDTAALHKLAGNPCLTKVSYLKALQQEVKYAADCTSASNCSSPYGTPTSPEIVYIDGDFTLKGNESGAGILLVTGTLTFSGTPSYTGVILAIGAGNFQQNGGGHGTINGAMLVANINTPWPDPSCTCAPADCDATSYSASTCNCYAGVPTYNQNGGGSSKAYYNPDSISQYGSGIMPLREASIRWLH